MTDETRGPQWGEEHRNHPVITKTDWGVLTEEGYFDDRARPSVSRNQQYKKLRRRIHDAFLDLSLLFDTLPEKEREKLADELGMRPMPPASSGGPIFARSPIPEVIGFLFLLHPDADHFEETVAEAIMKTLRVHADWESEAYRSATYRQVEANIDVEEIHINGETVREKVNAGEIDALSDAERNWLIEHLARTGELRSAMDEAHRKDPFGLHAAQQVVNRLEDEAEENGDGEP